MSGIRILVVDDNPHFRWAGRVHPVNATFHRFLAAVLGFTPSTRHAEAHVDGLLDRYDPDDLPT